MYHTCEVVLNLSPFFPPQSCGPHKESYGLHHFMSRP